jgi:uncharacterized membrane protein
MQTNSFTQKILHWLVPIVFVVISIFWFNFAPPGLLGKADAIGYAVCHQIDERSFHMGGAGGLRIPLCARCSGMYLGAVFGLAFQAIASKKRGGMPPLYVSIPLIIFFLAFAVDGSNSFLYLLKSTSAPSWLANIPNLYIPNNTLRLFTGSGMGLGISAALFPAFNQTMWKDWDPTSAIGNKKTFIVMLGLMIILDLLTLTEWTWVLYPVAFISAGGVLLILTIVYSMVWAMIMKEENAFTSFNQLWLAGLAGLTIALLQIYGIDLFRYTLTGMWGAFPIK